MIALLLALALNAGQLDELLLPLGASPTPLSRSAPAVGGTATPSLATPQRVLAPLRTAPTTAEIVVERALAHQVDPSALLAVARCESRLNPRAVGDGGTSFGAFQLHRGGLLSRFFSDGYTDPFDIWQAADFTAAQIAGGHGGAWSCWGLARGAG